MQWNISRRIECAWISAKPLAEFPIRCLWLACTVCSLTMVWCITYWHIYDQLPTGLKNKNLLRQRGRGRREKGLLLTGCCWDRSEAAHAASMLPALWFHQTRHRALLRQKNWAERQRQCWEGMNPKGGWRCWCTPGSLGAPSSAFFLCREPAPTHQVLSPVSAWAGHLDSSLFVTSGARSVFLSLCLALDP